MKNEYSITEVISTTYSLIFTKLFYKGARLIRRPFYCRGKSRLKFGRGFTTGYNCRFDLLNDKKKKSKNLIIGEKCKIGDNVHIVAGKRVVIGDNVLIASKVFISDTSHGEYSKSGNESSPYTIPDERPLYMSDVSIGKNVWIGEGVSILLGVSIGDGCIIGANSVVNKSIPNNCIAVGIPAKIIKVWDEKKNRWVKY